MADAKKDPDPDPTQNTTDESDVPDKPIELENSEEPYKFHAKLCTRLCRELGLNNVKFIKETSDYIPPETTGLHNADVIIPSYYHLHKTPQKIQSLDFLGIIKDDIRNLRPLNKYQIEYIKKLSSETKDELILVFNVY